MFGLRALRLASVMLLLTAVALGACSDQPAQVSGAGHNLASMKDMPEYLSGAPSTVVESYRFAAANPDLLTHIPCYCGCGSMGHTSNYSCYISGADEDGKLHFDQHALGCSICVDITRDVMRLHADGEPLDAIRMYIDSTYSPFGPSNLQ